MLNNAYLGNSYRKVGAWVFHSKNLKWKWCFMKITYQMSTYNWICSFKRNSLDLRHFHLTCQNLWYSDCLLSISIGKSRYLLNDKEKYSLENNIIDWGWSKRCINASWSTFRNRYHRKRRHAGSPKFWLCNSWI